LVLRAFDDAIDLHCALTRMELQHCAATDPGSRFSPTHLAVLAGALLAAKETSSGSNEPVALRTLGLVAAGVEASSGSPLARMLAACPSLVTLVVTDSPLSNAGALAIAAPLRAATLLEELDLSGTDLGNKGLAAVINAVTPSLTTLLVSSNRFTDAGMYAFPPRLFSHLRVLSLARCPVTDAGIKALAGIARIADAPSALRELDLRGLKMSGKKAACAVVAIIGSLPRLSSLQLADVSLGHAGANILASGLRHLDSLRRLDLSRCALSDAGVEEIAQAVCHGPDGVSSLLLPDNGLKSADALIAAVAAGQHDVKKGQGLVYLDICANPCVATHAGVIRGKLDRFVTSVFC
jgi:Ran GTPase-activating protein (RanGAP) involved in mRNA processing and transport